MEPGGAAPPRPARKPRQPVRPLPEPREGFTALGIVTRAHSLRGEIRVSAFNPGAPNLQRGRRAYIKGARYTVLRARPDRDAWILQLSGVTDRSTAEGFAGELIEAADTDVRRNDADSFFIHELIGLRAITPDGRELGRVTEVLQTGANDVYVVKGEKGEILVPAVGEVVTSIDLTAGILHMTPLPGMVDESQ